MTDQQIIKVLEINRDANPDKPMLVEACNTAIQALRDNQYLTKRCYAQTRGLLCNWCGMLLRCGAFGKNAN